MKLNNSFFTLLILSIAANFFITFNASSQNKVMPPPSEQFYSLSTNQNNPMLTSQQPAVQQFSAEKTTVLQELNQARESNDMLRQRQAEIKLSRIDGNSMQTPASDPRAVCTQPLNQNPPFGGDYLVSTVNGLANWSIATATVPAGAPTAGRIWAVSTQYSSTGSDTMRYYYSDNGGATWSYYTSWYYINYNMNYRAGELDLEIVYDGTNVFLFTVAGFFDPSGRPLVNLSRFQVTGTFSFYEAILNFPGNATTTNKYYNPRITSDNISYPNTAVYLYISVSFDSTYGGANHWLRQKFVHVTSPTAATPTYVYSDAPWWNGSGYSALAYYYNDLAYYRPTSTSTNRIFTLISVNITYNNLYLAWSDDYGSTVGGSLVITETAPTRGAVIASSGMNTAADMMILYLRDFGGADWDVAYQWTTTGGTTTGAWTMGYLDFTGYYAHGYPDIIAVRGTTNQFKAAYNEDSLANSPKAFYAGWNGTAWSTPSRLAVNTFAPDTVFGKIRAGYKNGGGDDCLAIWAGVNGGAVYSTRACQTTTGLTNNNNGIPEEYALQQNYPNPFNPSTVIKYSIPQNSAVKLTVYDMTGRAVKTLVNQVMNPGNYEISFDASNFASGVYFYKLQAGSFTQTKKMMLIK
jgi:hypothetical protein